MQFLYFLLCLKIGFPAEVGSLKGILSKLSKLSSGNRNNEVGRVSRQVIKSIIAQSTSKGEQMSLPTEELLSKELNADDTFREKIKENIPKYIMLNAFFPPTVLKTAEVDEMDQMLINMIAYTLNVAGVKDVTAKDIINYGCWCSLEQHLNHGPSLDLIDEQCKARTQCRKCVEIDNQCNGKSHYTVYVDTQFAKPRLTCAHNENEADLCKMKSCECDLEFVNETVHQIKNNQFYPYYSRTVLDYQHVCAGNNRNSTVAELEIEMRQFEDGDRNACCGEHPNRFPFSTRQNRKCCHDRTYDESLFDCCKDGSVQAIGDC